MSLSINSLLITGVITMLFYNNFKNTVKPVSLHFRALEAMHNHRPFDQHPQ